MTCRKTACIVGGQRGHQGDHLPVALEERTLFLDAIGCDAGVPAGAEVIRRVLAAVDG